MTGAPLVKEKASDSVLSASFSSFRENISSLSPDALVFHEGNYINLWNSVSPANPKMFDLVGHQKLIYRSLTDTKHLAKLQGENHIRVILKELGIIITVLCQKSSR